MKAEKKRMVVQTTPVNLDIFDEIIADAIAAKSDPIKIAENEKFNSMLRDEKKEIDEAGSYILP